LHLVGYLYYWQMGFNSVFKGLTCFIGTYCIGGWVGPWVRLNGYGKEKILLPSPGFDLSICNRPRVQFSCML